MSVYFVRHGSLIKIGFSSHLRQRIGEIIAGIPGTVEFLGYMPGDRDMEAHLHGVFSAQRFSGEWFAESPALLGLIDTIAVKEMPSPEVPTPSIMKRLDQDDAWHQASERLRVWAALRWPQDNHRQRMANLQALLPFSRRRVRALYHYEPGMTLRTMEAEALAELMDDAETMSPVPLTPISTTTKA